MWGDADKDGTVNVRDCAYIARLLSQNKGGELPYNADFSGDNMVNVRDAASVARFLSVKTNNKENGDYLVIKEYIHNGEYSMEYFTFGHGKKTLVILPGLSVKSVMESASAVKSQYAAAENDFTVYLFDRRKEFPDTYSISDMAHNTIDAINSLGLSDIYLFGASQGGMIAQEIALQQPGLVKKLVLGQTAGRVTKESFEAAQHWIELAERGEKAELCLDFGEKIYPDKIFRQLNMMLTQTGESMTERELAKFIIGARSMEGFDILDRLSGIKCPVLVTGSADDKVFGSAASAELAKAIKNAQYRSFDGFGHAAFDTAPDYLKTMLDFFNE